MSAEDSIRILLGRGTAGREPLGPAEWKRVKARCAWVREKLDQWDEAMREMNDRCGAAVGRIDEEAFERLCDAEQAKVDAIRAELDAVKDHDRWPPHLHWGGI